MTRATIVAATLTPASTRDAERPRCLTANIPCGVAGTSSTIGTSRVDDRHVVRRLLGANRTLVVDAEVGGEGGNPRVRAEAFGAHDPERENTRTDRNRERHERDGEKDSFHGSTPIGA